MASLSRPAAQSEQTQDCPDRRVGILARRPGIADVAFGKQETERERANQSAGGV